MKTTKKYDLELMMMVLLLIGIIIAIFFIITRAMPRCVSQETIPEKIDTVQVRAIYGDIWDKALPPTEEDL